MLFFDVIIGATMGALLWPIVQRVEDAAHRATFGLIFGGLLGGALAWARLALVASTIIGAGFGASVAPIEQDIGLVFLEALFQTVRGAAFGALVLLSFRSLSFVITGAGIGLAASLVVSLAVRSFDQVIFPAPLTSTQITAVVILATLIVFGSLNARR
jgi:hypothetical protein